MYNKLLYLLYSVKYQQWNKIDPTIMLKVLYEEETGVVIDILLDQGYSLQYLNIDILKVIDLRNYSLLEKIFQRGYDISTFPLEYYRKALENNDEKMVSILSRYLYPNKETTKHRKYFI